MTHAHVRQPAVAGMFYPAEPQVLGALVDRLLAAAAPIARGICPKALIVPHAGFVYSGPIAASAYALLAPFADRIGRIVLVGPSHRVYLDGLAHPGAAALATPVGELAVDRVALAQCDDVAESPTAHAREHSLEVQLPFLARVVPNAKVVPLVAGRASAGYVARVLERLYGNADTVIVISSDLSHYLPYDIGRRLDTHTAERIVACDARLIEGEEARGCVGINGFLRVARAHGLVGELVDLRSSGDTAGSRDEVVGYGAFAFYEPKGAQKREASS